MQKRILLTVLSLIIFSFSFSQEDKESQLLNKANELYTNGEYGKAAVAFNTLYNFNNKENIYLYYAASCAVNAKDYKLAIQYYQKLRAINYDGITTEYYATNKKTKVVEVMSRKVRDSLVKSKRYKKPRKRKTKSKIPEITKNIALIYIQLGKNTKALEAVKQAIKENPKEIDLRLTEANIYYKLGDIETFETLLKKISKKEKKNVDVLFNLGVLAAQSNQEKLALKYYKKTIKINPNYVNAYINLSALILGKELEIVEEMNSLGNTTKDNNRYDALAIKRKEVYKEALPYLEKVVEIDNNQTDAINTLVNVYEAIEQHEKAKALKLEFNL